MSTTTTDELDQADMARLAAGHETSLNELMARHGERLFHFLSRMLGREDEANDLAQETFVRVYQNRSRFDGRRRFSTWLYTIAANLARDRIRWRARHPEVSLDAENPETGENYGTNLPNPGPDPSASAYAQERVELIRRAVAALPEELRGPFVLAEYEDLPHAEIAQVLSCSPKAVEMRIYRARQQLRAQLQPLLAGA